jgi:hypothetical protein
MPDLVKRWSLLRMFSAARIVWTLMFLAWSLLLLGAGGLVGWAGDGLGALMTSINMDWLASALAGLGKLVLFLIWLPTALLFALVFAMMGMNGRFVMHHPGAAPAASPAPAGSGTVTLERGADGVYR